MYNSYQKSNGFTLIELSIVLVIIGLIVGGVLVGRDLIKAGQIRHNISQVEQFKTAVYTFRSKFDCLPGDCINASTFWPSAANGNGNGTIVENNEIFTFWRMLGAGFANLISGSYSGTSPSWTISPGINVPTGWDSRNGAYVYRCYGNLTWGPPFGNSLCWIWLATWNGIDWRGNVGFAITTPNETKAVDIKFDDGSPSSGKIFGMRQSNTLAGTCTDLDGPTGGYTTPVSANYINNDNLECVLAFTTDF